MNPLTRLVPLLGLLCVSPLSNGCGSSNDEGDPPPGGGDVSRPCTVDQDCPDPSLFFCNTAASKCEAACRTADDCSAAKRGPFALAECDSNPLGCQCDMGKCAVSLCSRDADCRAGQVCRDGKCGAAPATTAAASCQVTPDFVLGRVGTQVRFDVTVRDATGKPVVLTEGITWNAEGVALPGSSSGPSATFTIAAPMAPSEAIEVRVGTVSCSARVAALPPMSDPDQVRVVVTDELTGRPLSGAVVVVADAAGTITSTADAGEGGVATVQAKEVVSITVFHADYGYLTLAHYDPAVGSRDLVLPLRRNPLELYGGAKGTFRNLPSTANLHLGFAGLSMPGLGLDLASEQLQGPSEEVSLNLAGTSRELVLPASAWLALPSNPVRAEYSAPGVAGVCDASLAGNSDVEATIRAGRCGTRTGWALAGDVPPTEIPPSLLGPSIDETQVLAQSIPLLRRFQSSVVRDVQFRLLPTPGATSGAPDFEDISHFASVDHDFQQLPLGFQFAVRVPPLPRYRGAFLEGAFVLGGASVPGQGLVPLGLGIAVNVSPSDPNTDVQAGLPAPGLVSVRMAPTHHGLEGSPYRLMVLATSNAAINDVSAGSATSGLVESLAGLSFDPKGLNPVTINGGFLSIPDGARYNFEPTAYRGLEGRQFRFVTDPGLNGSTLLRIVFTNRAGHRWTVLMDPSRALSGVRLPVPPAPFEDRTYFGDLTGTRSLLHVQALSARAPDGSALGPVVLAESNDRNLARLEDFTRAWSMLDYRRPEISWISPDQEGQTLSRGSSARVQVSGFRIGSGPTDDGYVQLSFTGGIGCEGLLVRGDVDASQGKGEVELQLPSTCVGQGISLNATLVDPLGVPLRPQVSSSRVINIQ